MLLFSREDLAWAAGLFEGEGCFAWTVGNAPTATMSLTDEDVLRRFHEIVGGKVREIPIAFKMTKPAWLWVVYGGAEVERVWQLFVPWLGLRRRTRGSEIIEQYKSWRRIHRPGPQSELCPDDVRMIREGHEAGRTQESLAHAFGVAQPTISKIVRDITWRDIEPIDREVNRQRWRHYLQTCPTYGTMQDRSPEYDLSWQCLRHGGATDLDLVVDVGAGDCGLDVFLRSRGFRGQIWPIDGSISGVELNDWRPRSTASWFICLEVLEHLVLPLDLLQAMIDKAEKGVCISTPNPDVVDVLAVDPTHVTPIHVEQLERLGMEISLQTLNPGRGEGDTIFAWRFNR